MEFAVLRLGVGVLLLVLPMLAAAPSAAPSPSPAPELDSSSELLDVLDPRKHSDVVSGNTFLELARGYQRLGKKMILPLLVGILLKVASFVPLILGKLTLLAIVAIVASKLALLISAIVGTKKLYSSSMPYSYHHGGGHDWEGAASSLSLADLAHPYSAHQRGRGSRGLDRPTASWGPAPPAPHPASPASSPAPRGAEVPTPPTQRRRRAAPHLVERRGKLSYQLHSGYPLSEQHRGNSRVVGRP